MLLPKDRMKKALVIFVIEQSLIDIGGIRLYEKITHTLKKEFGASITDCYDHPEYLQQSLYDLYGESTSEIIKTIRSKLEEFDYQEPISSFIKGITR